ncbi:hypothetical protein [Robbsia sp. KACC 23696]|uniref:hypothetical protein n=1 Tax=Robbsia sp. KACC 23696 TaxID=3149231 RepID=UPI00325C0054
MTIERTSPLGPLLLPIDVNAMRIGHGDSVEDRQLVAPFYHFFDLPTGAEHGDARAPYISKTLGDQAQTFAGRTQAQAGIHLHWTLPQILRHGVQPKTAVASDAHAGAVRFPRLPNRWLITRFATSAAARSPTPAYRSRRWLVESDRLSTAPLPDNGGLPHPSVLYNDQGVATPCYLGWRSDLDLPASEDDVAFRTAPRKRKALSELTAIAYGSPVFTSLYTHCSTILGAYDDLRDLPRESAEEGWLLTYHVSGWYEGDQVSSDTCMGEAELIAAMCNDTPDAVPDAADRLVCAGSIDGLSWSVDVRYRERERQQYQDDPTFFALGQTEEEAIAAGIATRLGKPDLEALLLLLQFGELGTHDEATPADVDFVDRLHEATFKPVDAGRIWTLKRKTHPTRGKDSENADVPPPSAASLSALASLNRLQSDWDAITLTLHAKKQQLFADWQTWMNLLYAPDGLPGTMLRDPDVLRAYIEEQADDIATLQRMHRERGQASVQAEAALEAMLVRHEDAPFYDVVDVAAPRHWQAEEPVLMLFGGAARRLSTPILDTPAQRLVTAAIPTMLALDTSTSLDIVSLFPIASTQGFVPDAIAVLIDQLAREAVLTSSAFERYMSDRTHAPLSALRDAFTPLRAPRRIGEQSKSDFDDTIPSATVRAGRNADAFYTRWRPVMMRYAADVHAACSTSPCDASPQGPVLDRFHWADRNTLLPSGKSTSWPVYGYEGTSLLSDHGNVGLIQALDALDARLQPQTDVASGVDDIADAERSDARASLASTLTTLRDFKQVVGSLPQLAQSLTGLYTAMSGFVDNLQLNIADPYASQAREPFIDKVRKALERDHWLSPRPTAPFLPIDGGGFTLRCVEVLDAFGRTRRFDDFSDRLAVATRMRRGPDMPEMHAQLPARLVQAAQLHFRWALRSRGTDKASASDASDTTDTTEVTSPTPILGWALYQPLENALVFYGNGGAPIVAISSNSHAPGLSVVNRTYFPNARTALASHPELQQLLDSVTKTDETLLRFMTRVRAGVAQCEPATGDQSGLTHLVGRPLALVHATIQIALRGGAALDQGYTALQARIDGAEPARTHALRQTRFEVKLGGHTEADDGLISYWLGSERGFDFDTFHGPANHDAMSIDTLEDVPNSLILSAGDGPPTSLALLIDPFAEVNARSGILPAKAITLPAEYYASTLKRFEFAIHASPTLALKPRTTQDNTWAVVHPRYGRHQWQWRLPVDADESSTSNSKDLPLCDANERPLDFEHDVRHLLDGWLMMKRDAAEPATSPDPDR